MIKPRKLHLYQDQLIQMYDDGLSIGQISKNLSLTRKTITRWYKYLELDTNRYSCKKEVPLDDFADEIIKKYNSGIGSELLSREYSCSRSAIGALLNRHGIKPDKRKYTFDTSYFDKIDTHNKAYTFGFICADGCNTGKALHIEVADKEVLEFIKEEMQYTGEIQNIGKRKECHKELFRLRITSVELAEQLDKIGCPQKKTHILEFPDLNKELIPSFILGLFDADGSITADINDDKIHRAHISWIGNDKVIYGIVDYLLTIIPELDYHIYNNSSSKENIITLRISNIIDVVLTMDHLYGNSYFCLERKIEKFLLLRDLLLERKRGTLTDSAK